MKITVDRREAVSGSVEVAITAVPERGEKAEPLPSILEKDDAPSKGIISTAWEKREIRGKKGELTTIHRPDGKGRILVVGLGPKASLDAEGIRRCSAAAVKALKGKGARTVGFRLAPFVSDRVLSDAAVRAICDGALLGGYEFLKYKATTDAGVEEVAIMLGEEHGREESALKKVLDNQSEIVESVLFTRDVTNVPPDTATPQWLAEQAVRLSKEHGIKVTVFDEKKLAEMHCGGILAVGMGSAHPPRMIVLEYPGGSRSGKTVAVVGKGITFDSGGISIKPATNMADMKFDKSGACDILGILRAAAALKLPPRVVGVMACAENLPGGSAYRPGDVVRSYGGKTIEIRNTDAEGRVVLSDALSYVVEKYRPDAVIDLATLTGAQVIALGDDMGAVVGNDDALAQRILDASAATGEPFWKMPLTDYHRELVKSDVADVRNSIEISIAGVLTGAAFLESFVGGVPWAHLDIAGAAFTTPSTRKYQPAYQSIGATGFGVRTVVRYLADSGR
jgi:leucyl aminopeptidase